MANVSSLSKIAKGFNDKVLDSKILNKVYKSAKANPAGFVAKMALTSALTKDAVGCYYYVTQSLNNERIPEEKRKFVASVDLMNGILNVLLQFTVGVFIDKSSPKFFDKYIDKKLNTNDTREIAKKVTDFIKENHPDEKISFEQVDKFLRTNKALSKTGKAAKWLKVGFSAATMLFATQIFTKRVIVPFLATPLAGAFKARFLDKQDDNNKDDFKLTPAMIDSTMPKVGADRLDLIKRV